MEPRRARLLLIAILAIAALLRLWGATFGLPFSYQVSENMYMIAAQRAAMNDSEELEPLFGAYQIVLLVERQLLLLVRPLLERLPLPQDIDETIKSFGPTFNLLGRWTSSLAGALSILPVFWIGRRLWDRRTGLLAALFLAVAFLHVRSSHFAKPEILSGLFLLIGAYFATRFPERRWRDYLWAGVMLGAALSAKLLAWPLIVVIWALHAQAVAGQGTGLLQKLRLTFVDLRLIACAMASIAAFAVLTPQAVLRPVEFYEFWSWVSSVGQSGGMERFDIHSGTPVWRIYLTAYQWGFGWVLGMLSLAGIAVAAWRRRPGQLFPLLLFPLLLVGFLLLPGNLAHERYVLLTIPFLVLPAAALVVDLARPLRRVLPPAVALAALAGLAIVQPALASLRFDYLIARPDTRTLAKQWIEENIPEDSAIALEVWYYSPQLSSLKRAAPLSKRIYYTTFSGPYGLSERSKVSGPSEGTLTVGGYILAGFDYIVTDGFTEQLQRLDPHEEKMKQTFYRTLAEKGELIARFSPFKEGREVPFYYPQVTAPATKMWDLERNGPVIRIYKLPRLVGR